MTEVMGIVNVTTDSFSDGGKYLDVDSAVAHAKNLWQRAQISSTWVGNPPDQVLLE